MPFHLLINALSASFGGGSVVSRELARHLAIARPEWSISVLITRDKPAHVQLRGDLADTRLRFIEAPPNTSKIVSRWLWENRSLASLLKQEKVDVLFQPNGMIPRGVDVPVFAHVGDPWPYLEVRDRWYDPAIAIGRRRGHGRAVERAAAMGFTSGFLMNLMRKHFGKLPARSDVYYNGLPAHLLDRDPSSIVPLERRTPTLISVSLVSPYKRQEMVIRALARVVHATGRRDLRYRILGQVDTSYKEDLMMLAEHHAVADRVTIEGRVEQTVVDQAYATSACFVLPSLSESFGLPSIEAMSHGTPVVVARAGATPEVCSDAALFCEPDNLESLIEQISRVLDSFDLASEMQQRGLRNIPRFDWRVTSQKLASVLEGLTARPALPA